MPNITSTRSDFVFGAPGVLVLPRTDEVGLKQTPANFWEVIFPIPRDAQPSAVLVFTYGVGPGNDSSVDVEFEADGRRFEAHASDERSYQSITMLTPGTNKVVRFSLNKGGSVPGPDGVRHTFGGAGFVLIRDVVIHYQRTHSVQEHWQWCHKCQGLFFGENAGSVCPGGGSHENVESGNYRLAVD